MCDAYTEEKIAEDDIRIVMKLPKHIAPYQFAVLPLSSKLEEKAKDLYEQLLKKGFSVT
jgi:glycyl-tRNA synthetase